MSQNFWVFSVLGWAGSELQGSSYSGALSLSTVPRAGQCRTRCPAGQGLRCHHNYCLTAQWSVEQI